MLLDCAPGFTWDTKTHSRSFFYKDRFYRSFPKHDDIHLVHVRKLVRSLLIDEDCVYSHLPAMRPRSATKGGA